MNSNPDLEGNYHLLDGILNFGGLHFIVKWASLHCLLTQTWSVYLEKCKFGIYFTEVSWAFGLGNQEQNWGDRTHALT